jgi:hypothetical protein
MKFDFKPYKVKLDIDKKELVKINTMPFYGNSTYSSFFPNWKCSQKIEPKNELPFLKIPFRGNSTYGDNFFKKKPVVFSSNLKPINNLEFKGKFYRPEQRYNDYDKKAYLNDGVNKSQNEKSILSPADYPKKFDSTYRNEFNNEEIECKLAKYLKNNGMKNLNL